MKLELLHPHKHTILLRKLKFTSNKRLKSILKVSDDLLEQIYFNLVNYDENPYFHAFEGFSGLVFKGLDKASYQEKDYQYIIIILQSLMLIIIHV